MYENEARTGKRWILWVVGLCVVVSIGAFLLRRTVDVADSAVVHYEEFQEIYNTCQKVNTDLCNMNAAPDGDPMFAQFSKEQRLLALRTTLNRWVQEYNAKSRMWNRALWKSHALPYDLSVDAFPCFARRTTP